MNHILDKLFNFKKIHYFIVLILFVSFIALGVFLVKKRGASYLAIAEYRFNYNPTFVIIHDNKRNLTFNFIEFFNMKYLKLFRTDDLPYSELLPVPAISSEYFIVKFIVENYDEANIIAEQNLILINKAIDEWNDKYKQVFNTSKLIEPVSPSKDIDGFPIENAFVLLPKKVFFNMFEEVYKTEMIGKDKEFIYNYLSHLHGDYAEMQQFGNAYIDFVTKENLNIFNKISLFQLKFRKIGLTINEKILGVLVMFVVTVALYLLILQKFNLLYVKK